MQIMDLHFTIKVPMFNPFKYSELNRPGLNSYKVITLCLVVLSHVAVTDTSKFRHSASTPIYNS